MTDSKDVKIEENKYQLMKIYNLEELKKYIFKQAFVIYDDLSSCNDFFKNEEMKNIFYNGRHVVTEFYWKVKPVKRPSPRIIILEIGQSCVRCDDNYDIKCNCYCHCSISWAVYLPSYNNGPYYTRRQCVIFDD